MYALKDCYDFNPDEEESLSDKFPIEKIHINTKRTKMSSDKD